MENNTNLQVFIDGASRGNPGHAGAGIFITQGDKELIKTGIYLGLKTNNQAEYLALALAAFFLKNLPEIEKYKVLIISDSELLVRQMQGQYKIKNEILLDLKFLIDKLLSNVHFKIEHVLREKNKIADKLANEGINKKNGIPAEFIKLLVEHGITNI